MGFLIALAVVGALACRAMSPAQRDQAARLARGYAVALQSAALRRYYQGNAYRTELGQASSRPLVVPAIVLAWVIVVGGVSSGGGPPADRLLAWGASLGTQTTNGGWWRLLTAAFVHGGLFHAVVDAIALIYIGALVERFVGRLAIGTVYVCGAGAVGLATIAAYPLAITSSASGGVASVCGLLLALVAAQQIRHAIRRLRRTGAVETAPTRDTTDTPGEIAATVGSACPVTQPTPVPPAIPTDEIRSLAIAVALFMLYASFATTAAWWGFAAGVLCGGVLMGSRTEEAPSTRRVAVTAALAASAMVAAALPLRHIADVKPEVAGLVAADIRTKQRFDTALDRFNKGKTTAADVASVAAGTNVAELQAVDARLASLTHVPPEHEQLVRDAREYVRVRCDAWRLRADAVVRLHAPARASIDADNAGQRRLQSEARFRSNMKAAGRAEAAERTAAAAFDRLRDAAQLP